MFGNGPLAPVAPLVGNIHPDEPAAAARRTSFPVEPIGEVQATGAQESNPGFQGAALGARFLGKEEGELRVIPKEAGIKIFELSRNDGISLPFQSGPGSASAAAAVHHRQVPQQLLFV